MNNTTEHVKYIVTYTDGVGYRLRDVGDAFCEVDNCNEPVRGLINQYGLMSNIYVMYRHEGDVCKIGVSDDPERRMRELGFDLLLSTVSLPRTDAFNMEGLIHSLLTRYRHYEFYPSVEYFCLPENILERLSSIRDSASLFEFIRFAFDLVIKRFVKSVKDEDSDEVTQDAVLFLTEMIEEMRDADNAA